MEKVGKVIKTDKNIATVFVEFSENCEFCEFSNFCRIDKKGREVVCKNDIGADVGDIVSLDAKGKNIALAIGLNFVLPLIFLILGVLIGKQIWQTDLAGFLSGISLICCYFLVFQFLDKKILKSGSLLPEITSIKTKKNSTQINAD